MNSRMAGQTLNDRILAAKHSIAGQGLAKSVCKATTEELIGPKKKHLDYLIHCTNEPNVSIPQLANLLIDRSQNTNWIVVFKALITVHNLMCYGNERFTQYLASSNSSFQLSNFLDKSGVQGALSVKIGYDMSPFIRKYARYLNEKAMSYRTVAFDFCKIKRGKEDGILRTMNAEKLLKTIPTLQNQLDSLLEFDCSANDLANGVINMCFMLLFRDLIRLFACYNDGIINLLEKYFDMNKKQCKEALDIYKKFLVRMDKVGEFLKVAENVGIDKGDIPDLTKAPSSLLEALEQHLQYVEGKNKSSTASTPQSTTSSNQKNIRSGVSALSSTSSSFGTVVANGRLDSQNGIDESLKLKALAEEEAAINQFNKTKTGTSTHSTPNNPFLSSTTTIPSSASQPTPIADLFATDPVPALAQAKASDDLLQLSNPFADAFTPSPVQNVYQQPIHPWLSNGFSNVTQQQVTPVNGPFVSESNFSSVFGNTESSGTADGNVNVQSYNPFLNDDSEPPMLLDTDSPTNSHVTPIQDVLKFFQKDESFLETERNINNATQEKVSNKIQFNKNFSVDKESPTNFYDNAIPISDIDTDLSKLDEVDKCSDKKPVVPPPRPPPPNTREMRKYNEKELDVSSMLSPIHDPIPNQSNPETLSDNNISPSMFTANEELSVFSHNTDYNSLAGVLQPTSLQSSSNQTPAQQQVSHNQQQQQQQSSSALITGDLESSLASLAENLSINNRPPVKSVQWNSPKNGSKVANNWTPQPMAATTGAGYKPMNQSLSNQQIQPITNMQPQMYPGMQPVMPMRPMVPSPGMLPARAPGMTTPTANTMNQQSLLFH